MAKILNQRGLLPLFLSLAAAAPFQLGEWDCAMTLANWWSFVLGVDPAPHLRGKYNSERGWMKIVARAGGLEQLVGSIAMNVGGIPIEVPSVGDIGVVIGKEGSLGAIWAGKRWVGKSPTGMSAGPAQSLGIWGLR